MAHSVSVVMPVFNGQAHVGDAISSVLNQTFTNFELVVVDDGSTDHTLTILQRFATKDRRVRIHQMPRNSGSIAARNAGSKLATGDFIAVMDADDISLPTRLAVQLGYLTANPEVGVVGSYVQIIDGDGKLGTVRRFPALPGLMAWSMFFFNSVCHPTVTMRRSLLHDANWYATECKGGTEDYDLFVRLSRVTRMATIPDVLVHYRKWEGNMTRQAWDRQETDATRIVKASVNELLGIDISPELAYSLRGLARDQYPTTSDDIRAVGTLVRQLYAAFNRLPWLTATDRAEVSKDAGIKLWLLASLATGRSWSLARHLSSSAISVSPFSLFSFAAKVVRRLSLPAR